MKTPRSAIPSPRSEIAASEPYQIDSNVPVPSGEFPSPNDELAAAQPYKGSTRPKASRRWPIDFGFAAIEKETSSLGRGGLLPCPGRNPG